ncbi:conserved unknown protein [Ectocarpus siliculosus]|uniref:Protein kinase domain-containing protein n=1 Tax=Ectocarpus siliculosus TaxID=2880 RepID=D7G7X9_ECTSI|nr:conserved unknown protein [Ectocarpus siliculosus]|eukprot:CBJ27854.1 conserved unknown protein [Ectocarpus siliculosus]
MLEMLLILLLGLSALLDTSAGGWVGGWVGSSDIGEYHRCNGSSITVCSLPRSWPSLGIHRDLTYNELTTLPEGIFGGLTALEYLTQTLQTHRAHETSSPNELPSLPSCSDHFSDPRFTHGSSITVCSLPRSWPSLGIHRNLTYNELTTLPEGIFGGLTALESLDLTYNELTTLPEGIFGGLTALEYLELSYNELTTLPEGIFGGLTALELLRLYSNELTTLPEEIFGGLTALERLSLSNNELTTLPEGLFGGLTALELLWLLNNSLTTLPDGIFQGLPALTTLTRRRLMYLISITFCPPRPQGIVVFSTSYSSLVQIPNGLFTVLSHHSFVSVLYWEIPRPEYCTGKAVHCVLHVIHSPQAFLLRQEITPTLACFPYLSTYTWYMSPTCRFSGRSFAATVNDVHLQIKSRICGRVSHSSGIIVHICWPKVAGKSSQFPDMTRVFRMHMQGQTWLSGETLACPTQIHPSIPANLVSRGSGHICACACTCTGHGRAGISPTTYAGTRLEPRRSGLDATYSLLLEYAVWSITGATPSNIDKSPALLRIFPFQYHPEKYYSACRLSDPNTSCNTRKPGTRGSGDTCACGCTYTGHARAGIFPTTYLSLVQPKYILQIPAHLVSCGSGDTCACGCTCIGHARAGIFPTIYAGTQLELRSPDSMNAHGCSSVTRLVKKGASTVEIVVGVVAGALAVAALGFFLRRRRAAKSTDPDPPAPASYGADSLEYGRVEQHQQRQNDIHSSSPIMGDSTGGNVTRGLPPPAQQSSPPPPPSYVHNDAHRHDARPPAASQHHAVIAAEKTFGGDDTPVQSLSTAPAMGALPKPSSEGKSKSTRDNSESGGGARTADAGRGGGDAAEDGSGCVAASTQSLLSLTTRNSAAEVSTEEGTAEVAEFGLSADADGAPSAAALPPAAAAGGRRRTSSGVGCGQAVLAAAEKLAHSCQIPGISEAATAVSILIRLVLDSRDLTSSPGVKRCRSIVVMLERASKVLGNVNDLTRVVEMGTCLCHRYPRVLMEEVHDAVSDLVELIKTYQNKSKVGKVLTSTLFKRRQGELNAVIDRAIWGLHLGLQVQVGHDVAHLVKRSTAEAQTESLAQVRAQAESLAEARRSRRQRKLDQIEIPEDHVSITDEMLGKGGFGVVYLADYNGHNAAAKKAERKAFLRELDAMIRLRSPHIVNIYGAITSLPDRLILVMELLAGGDLRAMLKNSEQPLPKDKCRQIIQDVCVGMAFLHGKATVHGDLKSANVLLDDRGRAKIGDFGTSRWAERSAETVTNNTNPGPSTHISFAWTAPEVLETKETSKAGDVYSFGMVAWEVLTRQTPWDQARPRDIYLGVVMREERPAIPAGAPVDIAEMVRKCWAQEPKDRPTFPVLCNRGNAHRRLQAPKLLILGND